MSMTRNIPKANQKTVKLQAAIAAGASGMVKHCYYSEALTAWVEYGGEFLARNMGPSNCPISTIVTLGSSTGDLVLPTFQYTAVTAPLALADNTGSISAITPAVGAAVTGKRSDAADGLKCVGTPAEGTAHVFAEAEVATLQPTTTAKGFQVKLAAYGDQEGQDYAQITATAEGVAVPVEAPVSSGTGAIRVPTVTDAATGLCPQLPVADPTLKFLRGDGAFAAPVFFWQADP